MTCTLTVDYCNEEVDPVALVQISFRISCVRNKPGEECSDETIISNLSVVGFGNFIAVVEMGDRGLLNFDLAKWYQREKGRNWKRHSTR